MPAETSRQWITIVLTVYLCLAPLAPLMTAGTCRGASCQNRKQCCCRKGVRKAKASRPRAVGPPSCGHCCGLGPVAPPLEGSFHRPLTVLPWGSPPVFRPASTDEPARARWLPSPDLYQRPPPVVPS